MTWPNVERETYRQFDGMKILVSFFILFALYHAAEYQTQSTEDSSGALLIQFAFFGIAYLLGRGYRRNGLISWGLPFSWKLFKSLFFGIILGLAIYATAYFISVNRGLEIITDIPNLNRIFNQSLPFTLGAFLPSFSEDILTQGLIFAYFSERVKGVFVILISAALYLLNHIYQLTDGPDTLLYLFLMGTVLMVAMVNTKNLWFAGGMNWAGNTFFYISHDVIRTEVHGNVLPPNYLLAGVIVLFIPVVWLVTRKIDFSIHTKRKDPYSSD